MLKKILLDSQEFHFTKSHLPALIHGEEHAGASLFTVTMLADLFKQGLQVVALTGYPMAIEEFKEQIGQNENAHFFTKERSNEFIDFISDAVDINDYIVLLKNIEFYGNDIFNAVKSFSTLIVSGDVNKYAFKEELFQHHFVTKIYFSPLDVPLPDLQKYEGFLLSDKNKGIVTVNA